ncbi:hypothetical protein L1887_29722 [Cichorium endivia]|nr:hypothetical protein L1887_29722 [Cichorium endivia]
MEFNHNNARQLVEEDRLSSLPDELIHKILSCLDMKFAIQTCFRDGSFSGNQCPVSTSQVSILLDFRGAVNQGFVRKIANYAISHNVQELDVFCRPNTLGISNFPPCLFSSHSLKHYTLASLLPHAACITPKAPWDFPALTTLHLCGIALRDHNSKESIDLFSKRVNLMDLTLGRFLLESVEVFDNITPQLSKLTLHRGSCSKVMNVIAPQLENLTVIDCSIKYLNAPSGLSSFCYRGYPPLQLSKDRFHYLNKVSICLTTFCPNMPNEDEKEYARKTINMLQEFHSARYLTLDVDIVELLSALPVTHCISSFPDLLLQNPSPFSNLNCLTIINSSMRKDTYKVKMSTEARNFLLENSPDAKFVMELPEGC